MGPQPVQNRGNQQCPEHREQDGSKALDSGVQEHDAGFHTNGPVNQNVSHCFTQAGSNPQKRTCPCREGSAGKQSGPDIYAYSWKQILADLQWATLSQSQDNDYESGPQPDGRSGNSSGNHPSGQDEKEADHKHGMTWDVQVPSKKDLDAHQQHSAETKEQGIAQVILAISHAARYLLC